MTKNIYNIQCYENNVVYVVNIGAKCEVVPITNKHNSLIFFSIATPVYVEA